MHFDISQARIVGPSGAEWKGDDLELGDRVRLELTVNGRLVRQISVLPNSRSAIRFWNDRPRIGARSQTR